MPERQSPETLRQQIAQLGLQSQITIRKSGNWHVRIGNYDLTITNPNEPISAANIVAGARYFEGRE